MNDLIKKSAVEGIVQDVMKKNELSHGDIVVSDVFEKIVIETVYEAINTIDASKIVDLVVEKISM